MGRHQQLAEHQPASRLAVRVVVLIIFLVVFSATALANSKRQGTALSSLALAATFEPTKSPTFQRQSRTSTPVPRISSLSSAATIAGQTQVDANTVALYHFDSPNGNTEPNATGQVTGTGTLNGNAHVTTSGLYAGALQTDGYGSYVRTGWLGNMPRGTVEAFVDFSTACSGVGGNFTIVSAGGEYGSSLPVMSLRNNGYLDFQILTLNGWVWATSGINVCRYLVGPESGIPYPPYDVWRFHHVAGTWGERGVEIWVDGVLHGVGTTGGPPDYNNLLYACNPQLQLASGIYPYCRTPVPAPTSAATPPGDYSGSLPLYNTFLIGCDSGGSCLNGRIDEVRISNIQRTFSPLVDPTSTPPPTQTPNVVTGEFSVDANTMLLHHFNVPTCCWVYDAVSTKVGWLNGSATFIPTGKYNSGLSLNGSASYVDLGFPTESDPPQGAVEAWINLTGGSNPVVLHQGSGFGTYGEELLLGVGQASIYSGHPNFSFGIKNPQNGQWHWVDSGVPPSAFVGSWHHVAGTWGTRGVEIWIDGQLCATNTSLSSLPYGQGRAFLAGCDELGYCLQGAMDELRISRIQRSYMLAPGAAPLRLTSPITATHQLFIPAFFFAPSSPLPLCGGTSSPAAIRSIP